MSNQIRYSEVKVKFVIHEGEVLALFPDEKFSNREDSITCYAKIGQHGDASNLLLRRKRAKPEQYYSLLKELRGIYENPNLDDNIYILKIV